MSFIDEIKDFTENNLGTEVMAMGIEITDDELLSMDPQMLVELQQYLKNYRDKNSFVSGRLEPTTDSLSPHLADNAELRVLSNWELDEAKFEEVEDLTGRFLGTRVTQNNVTYIARRWRMTSEVKEILTTSASLGFDKFWRFNHPQESYLKDNINYLKGCHHIGCSSNHNSPWVFVLGAESLSRRSGTQVVKEITFNRVYNELLDKAVRKIEPPLRHTDSEIKSGTYKIQRGGGKCYTTHPANFQELIKYFADHLIA